MSNLKIYNSILFGSLRPWFAQNSNQDSFSQKLSADLRCESGLNAGFLSILTKVMPDPADLQPEDLNSTEDSKISFPFPLINYELPAHYNPKTDFYFHLIKNDGTRFINKLNEEVIASPTKTIARSLISDALEQLKYLLSETATQFRQFDSDVNLPFATSEDSASLAIKKDTGYILRILQWTLVRLILEVQELFPHLLTDQPLAEDDIYNTYIGNKQPQVRYVKRINVLNEFLIRRYLTQYEFSLRTTIERIDFTKREFLLCKDSPSSYQETANRNEALLTHILVLENLIFCRLFIGNPSNPSYEDLIATEFNDNAFRDFTTALQYKIEQYPSANKRLEIIGNEMSRYSFLKSTYSMDEALFKPSAPRRVFNWLKIQKAFLEANLHIDLSKLSKAEITKIPTDLTVAELAYLFKALYDARLLKPLADEDLYRAISAFFSSRKKEDVSVASIKNKYLSPEGKAVEFWETGFSKLLNLAHKKRQELSE